MAGLKEEQHLSAEEVVKSVNRGSNSIYPFMGSNGIPQFHSPTALYSRSKISPVNTSFAENNVMECFRNG